MSEITFDWKLSNRQVDTNNNWIREKNKRQNKSKWKINVYMNP